MTEQDGHAMTHEPPDNTKLALLNAFIDQRVSADLVCHKNRMFDLLKSNGLIARSIAEQRFMSRILSMYAQTKACSGVVGVNRQLDTRSLDICHGKLNDKIYVAIINHTSQDVILKGPSRDTETEAMESFIDAVLLTSHKWRIKIETQRDEHNAAVTHDGV